VVHGDRTIHRHNQLCLLVGAVCCYASQKPYIGNQRLAKRVLVLQGERVGSRLTSVHGECFGPRLTPVHARKCAPRTRTVVNTKGAPRRNLRPEINRRVHQPASSRRNAIRVGCHTHSHGQPSSFRPSVGEPCALRHRRSIALVARPPLAAVGGSRALVCRLESTPVPVPVACRRVYRGPQQCEPLHRREAEGTSGCRPTLVFAENAPQTHTQTHTRTPSSTIFDQ
jgi:hypothetical protein